MSRYFLSIVVVSFWLFATANYTSAQGLIIQEDMPFGSASLAAHVLHRGDEPIAGATVEWLRSGWGEVRRIKTTNANGYFSFGESRPGIYWLRLHAPGFQQHLIKIRVAKRFRAWPK